MNAMIFVLSAVRVLRANLIIAVVLLGACTITPAEQEQYKQAPFAACAVQTGYVTKPLAGTLTVLSLNIAHGRKGALNQILVSKKTIHHNLYEIAMLLKRANTDIVALQEADSPSRWSGGFDHVAELAQQAGYTWYCHAAQAHSWMYDYGTALLSKYNFTDVISHSFAPAPLTPTKGFILGQVRWYPTKESPAPVPVDIVSVHLDFSSSQVREQQLAELTSILSARRYPVIVLGDFNSDWFEKDSNVQQFLQQSGLQAYSPEATDLGTYRKNGRRFDWILISSELEYKHYSVLPDVVSDHYAVTAEIGFKTGMGTSK